MFAVPWCKSSSHKKADFPNINKRITLSVSLNVHFGNLHLCSSLGSDWLTVDACPPNSAYVWECATQCKDFCWLEIQLISTGVVNLCSRMRSEYIYTNWGSFKCFLTAFCQKQTIKHMTKTFQTGCVMLPRKTCNLVIWQYVFMSLSKQQLSFCVHFI